MDAADEQAQQSGYHRHAADLVERAADDAPEVERPLRLLVPALAIVFLAALDLTVIAPILPSMLSDLQVNTAEADRYVWVVSGYLLAYILTIPLMGRLSDIIGRRTTFLMALVIFLGGSAYCSVSHSLAHLIAARAIQGFGGGAMVPVAMALVGDVLPPRRRAGALGIVAAADTLGWVLGPLWGAAIQQLSGGWRWIFVLNIPLGLAVGALLLVAWRAVPLARHHGSRLDLPGAVLLMIGLLCLNLGVSVGAESGAGSGTRALGATANPLAAYRLPLIVVGVVALLALIAVEAKVRSPLIPLDLFRRRHFASANLANFLVGAALMVAMVNVPLLVALLVDTKDASLRTAELLAAFSLTMAIGALIGGRITEQRGEHAITWIGLVVAAFGYWQMSHWGNTLDPPRMVLDLAIAGIGIGLVIAPIGSAAINAARRGDLGIASGLVIVMRLLGMTLGISALTAWSVARLNDILTKLPTVTEQPGETLAHYLQRQQDVASKLAIPATIGVIRDTFTAAAVICLIAILPALFLYTRRPRSDS